MAMVAAQAAEASVAAHPLPSVESAAAPTRVAAEAALPSAAVAFYKKAFGVDESTATDHLATQAMGVGLAHRLDSAVGAATVAQLWFDNDAGSWVADVSAGASDQNLTQAFSAASLDGHYRVEHVVWTRASMQRTLDAITSALGAEIGSGQTTVVAGSGKVIVTATDRAAGAAQAAVAAAIQAPDAPPVAFERSTSQTLAPAPTVACAPYYCDTLTGGVRWWSAAVGCTMAFYVGLSGDPHPLFLTAGHCDLASGGGYQPIWTCDPGGVNCSYFGQTIPYYYYGYGPDNGGDAGLFEDGSDRPAYAGYYNWSVSGLSPLHAYYSTNAPVGLVVCLNGASNGSSCGTITSNDASTGVAAEGNLPAVTLYNVLQITGTCSISGDSGGPVTQASYEAAVGMQSTGEDGDGTCNGTNHNYVEPVGRALSYFGAVIYGY
jgi:predicted enzyme related to lactoylglutathione lyase